MGLIYDYASKSRSRRAHAIVYGSDAPPLFRAVGLDDTFEFECKMTGNCCRGRSLASNTIFGDTQVIPIRKFCEASGKPIAGIDGKTLWLDGLDPMQRQTRVAVIPKIDNAIGVAYVGPHGKDCQFLDGNLCGIHPVKPVICRLAPIGIVIEHGSWGGWINLSFHEFKKIECRECMTGPRRTVRDWISGVITNDFLNDERERAGWSRIGKS